MSNIIDKIQLSGVTYDIGGSGGKAIEAGRGIAITTGETADTVSFNLPISAGTGTDSVKENYVNNVASGSYSHAEGQATKAYGTYSHAEGHSTSASGLSAHAEGELTNASGSYSHAEGTSTKANNAAAHAEGRSTTASGKYAHAEGILTVASGQSAHAEGTSTRANGMYSHAEGDNTITNNQAEHASGMYNVSNTGESASAKTLFSVGNGGWDETAQDVVRHNAFEVRQNGDIYITSGGTDIKLQDNLGGGGGGGVSVVEVTQAGYDALPTSAKTDTSKMYVITDAEAGDLTNYYTKTEVDNAITAATSTKQDTLVSGTNIKTINNQSLLGSGNIDIQGGTGGTSCTVDEKEILENYNEIKYGNYQSKVYYTYSGTPTSELFNYSFNIYDGLNNTYVNGSVNFGTGGHTGSTSGWDTYYSVTWDNTKKRYLFATNAGYYINSFNRSNSYVYLQVPIGTVSGTPCEAASTLTDAVNEALVRAQDAVNNIFLIGDAGSRKLSFSRELNNGNSFSQDITLTDLKFTDYNVLETDINVGLGTSGWTNINTSTCNAKDLNITKFKAVYDDGIAAYTQKGMWVYYAFSYSGGVMRSSFYISFTDDTTISVELPTTRWSAVYDSATSALTVTAPEGNVEYQGNTGVFSIVEIYSNDCKFGNGITLQQYAENTEPIRQYVQENRTALGGMKIVKLTQSAYDALSPNYDSNTLYVIVN